jgi:hypothetical protein
LLQCCTLAQVYSFAKAAHEVLADADGRYAVGAHIMCVTRRKVWTPHPRTTHILVVCDEDGAHACSCTLMATCGLVCKHYLAYLLATESTDDFSASLIHPRWLDVPQQQVLYDMATEAQLQTSELPVSAYDESLALLLRVLQAEAAHTGDAASCLSPVKVNARVSQNSI